MERPQKIYFGVGIKEGRKTNRNETCVLAGAVICCLLYDKYYLLNQSLSY